MSQVILYQKTAGIFEITVYVKDYVLIVCLEAKHGWLPYMHAPVFASVSKYLAKTVQEEGLLFRQLIIGENVIIDIRRLARDEASEQVKYYLSIIRILDSGVNCIEGSVELDPSEIMKKIRNKR